jgi:hypothetical protein
MSDDIKTFKLSIEAVSDVRLDGDAITLRTTIKAFRGELQFGQTVTSEITATLATFRDEAHARQWADQSFRSCRARVTDALLSETALTMGDEAQWGLADVGAESVDLHEVVRGHTRATRDRLRERFRLLTAGQPARWSRDELAEAVIDALNSLPPRQRTYAGVSGRLREAHAGKAPESAEALRKLLGRRNLDWGKLKSGQYFINKQSAAAWCLQGENEDIHYPDAIA